MKKPPVRHEFTADMVALFVERFLLPNYADAHPIAPFHREWWRLCCLPDPYVAIAAPREHAKSTSVNHAYGLATALGMQHPFQLKVSRTRAIAIEFLRAAKNELLTNTKLISAFGFDGFERDTEDDFIATFDNGTKFRMMAFGSEQAMRGLIWNTMRPSLVICDDLEDDEQVLSVERREKMMNWFVGTLLPISKGAKFRVVGTILHQESLLQNLLDSPEWTSAIYEAHNDDFSTILWPESFSADRLQKIKRNYSSLGKLDKYNMEYRNRAINTTNGFFQPSDFVELQPHHFNRPHTYYVGGDLAISERQRRDFTVLIVVGIDPDGYMDVVDLRRGRWDSDEIIDELFSIYETWNPDEYFIESGAILKTLKAMIETKQRELQQFLNIRPMVPITDKSMRARPVQARMRSKSVRFDRTASWFHDMEQEFLAFPRGAHDDQVDALAWIGMALESIVTPQNEEEIEDEEFRQQEREAAITFGRSATTGY